MALVTVEKCREFLNLEDDNESSHVEDLIDYVSAFIETYTKRTFLTATHTDYFDGNGTDTLFLNQRPVSSITSIHIDDGRSFGASTQISSSAIVLYDDEGYVRLDGDIFSRGIRNIKVIYVAGYSQSSIPPDVQFACIKLVQELYKDGKTTLENPDLLNVALQDLSNKQSRINSILRLHRL